MFIEIKKLNKSYGEGDNKIKVINNVSLDIEKGTICMIIGASGSGKSTFLNLIGAMDVADSGSIVIDGKDITKLKAAKLTDYSREYLGYIFQFYNLIPDLTVLENIETTQYLGKDNMDIDELIRLLGFEEHKNKFPSQLSGGQQQRCAIGRALVKKPSILLCDEPTGALDSKTSQDILELLEELNEKFGTTIIMVTHNNDITCMADHELVKNDIRRYSNVRNIQWFDWAVLLCISAGIQQNVSERNKTSGSSLCQYERCKSAALYSGHHISADVPVYGSQRTSCRCQRFPKSILDGIR